MRHQRLHVSQLVRDTIVVASKLGWNSEPKARTLQAAKQLDVLQALVEIAVKLGSEMLSQAEFERPAKSQTQQAARGVGRPPNSG